MPPSALFKYVWLALLAFARMPHGLATGMMNRRRQAMPSQDGKATSAEPNGQSWVGFGRVPQRLGLRRAAVSIGRGL